MFWPPWASGTPGPSEFGAPSFGCFAKAAGAMHKAATTAAMMERLYRVFMVITVRAHATGCCQSSTRIPARCLRGSRGWPPSCRCPHPHQWSRNNSRASSTHAAPGKRTNCRNRSNKTGGSDGDNPAAAVAARADPGCDPVQGQDQACLGHRVRPVPPVPRAPARTDLRVHPAAVARRRRLRGRLRRRLIRCWRYGVMFS